MKWSAPVDAKSDRLKLPQQPKLKRRRTTVTGRRRCILYPLVAAALFEISSVAGAVHVDSGASFAILPSPPITTLRGTSFPTTRTQCGRRKSHFYSSGRICAPHLWIQNDVSGNPYQRPFSSLGLAPTPQHEKLPSEEEQPRIDEFQPKTKTLTESLNFYVQYVLRNVSQARMKRRLSKQNRMKLAARLKPRGKTVAPGAVDEDGGTLETGKDKSGDENMSFLETLRGMNESRKQLIKLVGYDASLLVPSFGFLLLGALMVSIIPHYYSACITCVASGEVSRSKLFKALTGLAITSVLGALFTGIRGSLFWIAGSRGNYNVRVKLHRNLLLQEAAFFDSTETGILLSRLNNDVNKIGMVISFHVNVVLRQLAQFLFGAVYLVRVSGKLSLVAFGGVGLVAIVSAVYGRFARVLAEKVQNVFADASAVAETSFTMSETVRAFDGLTCETSKYESAQSSALELEEVQAWAYGSHKFLSDSLQTGLQCALLFACWRMGAAGGLPADKLTTFLFYVNFVLESSNEVGDQWAKIQSAIGASSSVFELIRRVPAIRDPVKKSFTPSSSDDENENDDIVRDVDDQTPIINMSKMDITYGAMDVPALNNVDLQINSGDRVAIVGRSGSGKSSMLRTILRFYDPSSGTCKLDGKSLTELTRREIASKVTVVEQEPHLFPMSLIENILYGIDKDAIDEDSGEECYSENYRVAVAEALDQAGLPVVGDKNDLGLELDTRVGEGGRTLSGGQRQRVAIARALIRSPGILLLDEPTAALDSKSEKNVIKALHSAMQKTRSMLMVTHRLGVVRALGVNKVLVLEKGKLAEMGHPEDLLRSGGIYAQLAAEQGIFSQDKDMPNGTGEYFSQRRTERDSSSSTLLPKTGN